MTDALFPVGGGGGGSLSSVDLPGAGGRGGLLEKEGEELGVDWRIDPPNPVFLFPGKDGGIGPALVCLFTPGTGGDTLLCKPDGTGLGVFGTGGGPVSGLEPKSGLGGGIRFLCGSGAVLLCPKEGPGNLPTAPGGEKGLADVVLPPGGSMGGLFPPESVSRFAADLSFGIPD